MDKQPRIFFNASPFPVIVNRGPSSVMFASSRIFCKNNSAAHLTYASCRYSMPKTSSKNGWWRGRWCSDWLEWITSWGERWNLSRKPCVVCTCLLRQLVHMWKGGKLNWPKVWRWLIWYCRPLIRPSHLNDICLAKHICQPYFLIFCRLIPSGTNVNFLHPSLNLFSSNFTVAPPCSGPQSKRP